MFLNDQQARVVVRYPVRLGQVPLPAQYPDNFLGYLGATQGWPRIEAFGGAPGGAATWYWLGDTIQPGREFEQIWPRQEMTAEQVAPIWAAWQAGQGTVVVTPPPAPAPAPTPPPTGDLAEITNIALPSAAVPAGAQFTLQVTVRNVGSVTWSPFYTIVFEAPTGTPTSAPQSVAALPSTVAPGQTVTVTLTARAPTQPGTYAYTVGFYNPTGQLGPRVTAGLVVTPAPVGPSGIPTTPAGYPPVPSYTVPTYTGVPRAPLLSPVDEQAGARPVVLQSGVMRLGLLGGPWWLWLLGVGLAGGVYYFFYTPAGRRRTGRQRVGGTTVPGRPEPSRRPRMLRRRLGQTPGRRGPQRPSSPRRRAVMRSPR